MSKKEDKPYLTQEQRAVSILAHCATDYGMYSSVREIHELIQVYYAKILTYKLNEDHRKVNRQPHMHNVVFHVYREDYLYTIFCTDPECPSEQAGVSMYKEEIDSVNVGAIHNNLIKLHMERYPKEKK